MPAALHKKLLQTWGDALLRYQLDGTGDKRDKRLAGGILCPACMRIHGRSGDALLPLVTLWRQTGEQRYLTAAEKLFAWSENMVRPDGSYNNDTNSSWNGITVFAANALGETLLQNGDALPPADRAAWQDRFAVAAHYLLRNIEALGGNINYPVTCAYTMALAARLLPAEHAAFAAKAQALAAQALAHLTPEGLLYGEGHPREVLTASGCRAVDLGYNVEESLPALALYAELTGDTATMAAVLRAARAHLAFLLPDGGWDNSFGSRSYKWSYWGSRTSDGCLAGFAVLARQDAVFATALQKNLALLDRCTADGLLYGGPMYEAAGEPPCIHHTICHAKAVAALVAENWQPPAALPPLPAEGENGIQSWQSLATHRLSRGGWLATVTAYDYQYLPGGHPTGGALSLLWQRGWGVMLYGGMDPYRQNEPNNMQLPAYQFDICPTPRLACGAYASSNDLRATVRCTETGGALCAEAHGRLCTPEQAYAGGYHLKYTLEGSGVFTLESAAEDAFGGAGVGGAGQTTLLLPIVCSATEDVTLQGRTAVFRRGATTLTLDASAPFAVPEQYRLPGGKIRRLFSPVGGFQSVVLALPGASRVRFTVKES